jgi:hypothetical protein
MKKTLTILFFLLVSANAFAQYRTIFGEDRLRISGFGAPLMNLTSMDGEFAYLTGGGGAAIINGRMLIGGYGYDTKNDINPSIKTYRDQGYQLSYDEGGLWLGWVFNPSKPIHITGSLLSGWGDIQLKNRDNNFVPLSDKVYVLTPVVELEANITSWFRLAAGANYRFAMGADRIAGYQNSDFSSPGAFVTFKFGWFRTRGI